MNNRKQATRCSFSVRCELLSYSCFRISILVFLYENYIEENEFSGDAKFSKVPSRRTDMDLKPAIASNHSDSPLKVFLYLLTFFGLFSKSSALVLLFFSFDSDCFRKWKVLVVLL